jgi:hypothetical protein
MKPYDKENHRSWAQWLMPVIISTQEAEIRRLMVRGQLGQKSSGNLSQKVGVVIRTCHSSCTEGMRRILAQASLVINIRPYMKNN